MTSSTKQRVISGLVLGLICLACLFYGKVSSVFLLFICGLLSIDEIEKNFVGRSRFDFNYILSQALFIMATVYFGLIQMGKGPLFFVYLAVVQNLFLILYLFCLPIESTKAVKALTKIPLSSGAFITIPFLAIFSLFSLQDWQKFFLLIIFINFGMDTFAWFWGKLLGKTKLWEVISPKKTVEGFVGGALSAAILGGIVYYSFESEIGPKLLIVFFFLACLSQVGDLIQSKLKRQIGIKDSSSLIPGHGGVYDRIDSVVFMAPFMAILVKIFYL